MIMKIGDHNFARAPSAHINAAKRVEITAERNSHGLSHIDPIVLPLIVAMGTSNTATKRDQHEMEINLN